MDIEQKICYPNCDLTIWLRSCRKEVTKKINGEIISGSIPNWLSGSLIRNGPGGINVYGNKDKDGDSGKENESESPCCKHLFDGPGLLQKFEFSNGKATYMNRFIQTRSHTRNTLSQRLVLSEFGTVATPDPCNTIFQRMSLLFTNQVEETLTDTANISIHPFGDEVYSLAETPFAHRIELDELRTVANVNLNTEIGIINHTSHPHVDHVNGKVYNIGQKLDIWNGPHYIIVEMDTAKKNEKDSSSQNPDGNDDDGKSPWSTAKILATIPSRWLLNICYMHSFCITKHYFILVEQPFAIFFPEMPINFLLGRKPIASCLKYFPEEDTIFHVIPREEENQNNSSSFQRRRRTFHSPGFFFLHTINAFERKTNVDGLEIIIDICCYKDPRMIDCMYADALQNAHSNPDYAKMFRGKPKRFRLNLNQEHDDDDDVFETNNEDKPRENGITPSLITGELIVDFGCETPRINYDFYDGKEYKFFYAISSDVDLDHSGLLVKVNTESKTYESWGEPELNSYPSEPIFIPSPNSKAEDDGIVLSTLLYGGENVDGPNLTSVIILDAQKWTPLCKINFNTGTSIPKCLHGWYFPKLSESTIIKQEDK